MILLVRSFDRSTSGGDSVVNVRHQRPEVLGHRRRRGGALAADIHARHSLGLVRRLHFGKAGVPRFDAHNFQGASLSLFQHSAEDLLGSLRLSNSICPTISFSNSGVRSTWLSGRVPSGLLHQPRIPETGAGRYPERRANDSHTPPPISATPDRRPSHRAGVRFRNSLRLAPAAIAQPASVTAAIATEMAHITAS